MRWAISARVLFVMARITEPRDARDIERLVGLLHPELGTPFAEDIRQGWRSFVAERDGKIVGYLLGVFFDCGIRSESSGTIEQLVVDNDHQHEGVGHELVEAFWTWLASEGIHLAFVSTMDGSDAAAFYERCGFRRCRGPWLVRADES